MLVEKIKSVMLGHAVGDALGVPAEFSNREELQKKPITDMVGYGTYSCLRALGRTTQVCRLAR